MLKLKSNSDRIWRTYHIIMTSKIHNLLCCIVDEYQLKMLLAKKDF